MKKKGFMGAVMLLAAGFANSQSKSVDEIIRIFNDNDRVPDYNYSVLLIDNISKNGDVEHMVVNQFGGGNNDLKNVVFDFKTPTSVKNTRVLQAEKLGRMDDRWIYMPELKVTRRIPATDGYKSFVGTELTYNDMTLRKPEEDVNEMMSESEQMKCGSTMYDCWKIKSTPVKLNSVEYGYRISWFAKDNYIPIRIEFYDKKNPNKMIKLYEVEKIEIVKGSTGIKYPLRRQNLVTNLVTGRKTRITVGDFKFDEKIPDRYFTQNWLTTGK